MMLERHYDDYFLREPVIPTCDQCDEELPEEPVEVWTKEGPIGTDDEGELIYDAIEYRCFTCTACGEDTIRTNLD